ncbi:P-loop containing nucleoside triphosphate hydrolase protein [Lophiotrema nucula]|uniref:P-loop containing nucleoside triphosphate hydrolase protein n=1 Tax=Lophiotrema nucula TaxID=690887 RepID=A0A6A5ZGN3_9PLEO|nr:P-loop containing nucleoside triphosphate hydrolase protein [Lophiotrema nucula]
MPSKAAPCPQEHPDCQELRTEECLPIRLVPHSQIFRFFGRQDILDTVHQVLDDEAQKEQRRFTLFGLGGSGKTQIAVEYTYRHLDKYQAVMCILADSPDKIQQGFRDVAELMGMERTATNAGQAKTYVLHRLANCGDKYLLVFDNVDDIAIIKDCFPVSKGGSILITTRDAASASNKSQYKVIVPKFSIEEGARFLDSLICEEIPATGEEAQRHDLLLRISSIFHGYPLGLSQVAGFTRSGGSSLENFELLLQDQKSSSATSSLPVDDYHQTLSKTWELLLGSLCPESRLILDILVYLDPDSVPYELFREGSKDLGSGETYGQMTFTSDAVKFWEALTGLRRQTLIPTNSTLQTMSIHRFSQDRARSQLIQDTHRRKEIFQLTLHLLTNAHPEFLNYSKHWAPAIWRTSEKFLPHVKTLQRAFLADPAVFKGTETRLAQVMYHCATYEFESNHYTEAAESFKTTRKVLAMAHEPDLLLLCDCFRVEGRLFNEMNMPKDAKRRNIEAKKLAELCIEKGLFDNYDSRMPRILTGLGNTMSQLGEFDQALTLQHEAMRLCREVPREQSDAATIVQLNLGFLILRMGDVVGAERLLLSTVDEAPNAAYAWYPLGNTYLQQRKVEESLAAHLTALRIYITWFGEYHTFVADSLYKTGEILLLHKADAQQASEYLRKAHHIYRAQSSCTDVRRALARCARMYAKSLEKLNKVEEAEALFEEAWGLREETEGLRGSPSDRDEDYVDVLFYWCR